MLLLCSFLKSDFTLYKGDWVSVGSIPFSLSLTLTLSRILVINRFGRNFLRAIVTRME